MTLDNYLRSLGLEPDSDEADRLIDWALDTDGDDEDLPDEPDDAADDMLSDDEVIAVIKVCIEADPQWREHLFAEPEPDDDEKRYAEFLATLGLEPDSPGELELLEQVFDVSFDDVDGCSCEGQHDGGCACGGHHHHDEGCDCGCHDDDLEPVSAEELIDAIRQWLADHPGWKSTR